MKNKLLLTLLTATCLFSSCTKENEVNMPQDKSEGNKVTFIVNTAPVTRTTVNTINNSTQFVENDKIGIFETSASITDANNYEYKVLSDGTLEAADAGKTLYYPNDANESINFYAYYPYNSGISTTDKVAFTVAADQSSVALYNANDFMAATTSGKKTDFIDGVSLTFSHKLALVQLTLIGDDASKVTAVTLNNCKPTTTWTFSSNVIEAASGTVQDIKMWKIKADANTYWALIPAQTITTGTVLFTMTAGETTYTYKPSASDIVFTDNKIKKFNIQLGTNGNTIAVSTDMDTTGWDDTENPVTGNGEAIVPEPTDLLGGNGNMENITELKTIKSGDIATTGMPNVGEWYVATVAENIAVTLANENSPANKFVKITTPESTIFTDAIIKKTWYQQFLACRGSNIDKSKYLTLTFKAKTNNITNKLRVFIKTKEKTGTSSHLLKNEEGTNTAFKLYTDIIGTNWTEYTIKFNPQFYGTSATGTSTLAATTDDEITDFIVAFVAETANVQYDIDDVSLVQTENIPTTE